MEVNWKRHAGKERWGGGVGGCWEVWGGVAGARNIKIRHGTISAMETTGRICITQIRFTTKTMSLLIFTPAKIIIIKKNTFKFSYTLASVKNDAAPFPSVFFFCFFSSADFLIK